MKHWHTKTEGRPSCYWTMRSVRVKCSKFFVVWRQGWISHEPTDSGYQVPLTTHTDTIKQRNKTAFAAQFPEVIPDSCSNKSDAFESTAICTVRTVTILAKISFADGRIILNYKCKWYGNTGTTRKRNKVQTERTAFLNSNLKHEQIRKADKFIQK
jgi:hypothetical protein